MTSNTNRATQLQHAARL